MLAFKDDICNFTSQLQPGKWEECFEILDSNQYIKKNEELISLINRHDYIIGFSLGGVLLLKTLEQIKGTDKKSIILISTPMKRSKALDNKLTRIINLASKNKTHIALKKLSRYVGSFGKNSQKIHRNSMELRIAGNRIRWGLEIVRGFEATPNIKVLSIYGESSKLVNHENMNHITQIENKCVPNSQMRVFNENFDYCKAHILQFLQEQ